MVFANFSFVFLFFASVLFSIFILCFTFSPDTQAVSRSTYVRYAFRFKWERQRDIQITKDSFNYEKNEAYCGDIKSEKYFFYLGSN
ncbi:hypothetical protein LEP1GSC082_0257 [Leptospira kirschneri str. H2]|nr:hypothetical protein LEP1GSC082_0257 [Leptospira kirschneri str. H2]